MNFRTAYIEMLLGRKIKRPCFKGYWYIDGVTGKLVIHMADGREVTEGDIGLSVQNSLACDWETVEG